MNDCLKGLANKPYLSVSKSDILENLIDVLVYFSSNAVVYLGVSS
jgi:hypothetical protein